MVSKNTPNLPAGIDQNLRRTIEKLSESTDIGAGVRGDPEQRYIRIVDLLDMGLAKRLSNGAQRLVSGSNLLYVGAPIKNIPPAPEDFEVSGGIGIIFLKWKRAKDVYSNHGYTEIWRSEEDNLSNAVLLGQTTVSFMHADHDVDYTKTYFYWIRFVSSSEIFGPYNSAVGTQGRCEQSPAEIIALLSGQIRASELHADLLAPINSIGTLSGQVAANASAITTETQNRSNAISTESQNRVNAINAEVHNRVAAINSVVAGYQLGITQEATDRNTAVSAEASQRTALKTAIMGSGNPANLDAVTSGLFYESKQAVANLEGSLVQQIAKLSAGSNSQFDYTKIWHFDTGIESWGGHPTAPTITNPSFLRLADHASAPRIMSPTGLAIDAAKYSQVRARVRKYGNPAWVGKLFWRKVSDGAFFIGQMMSVPGPSWDSEGFGLLTFNVPWSALVTIDQIRFDLTSIQDSTNWIEIDWIAVGRPSPGASSADLLLEQTARNNADGALAQSITNLAADVNGKASGSALSALTVRVTTAEGNVSTAASDIVSLKAQLPGGANLIKSDTDFKLINLDGTAIGWRTSGDGAVSSAFKNHAGIPWTPFGFNQIGCNVSGQDAWMFYMTTLFGSSDEYIGVTPGKRYCFSAYVAGHRCSSIQMSIEWINGAGVNFANTAVTGVLAIGGNSLSGWAYNFVFGVPPAGATHAGVLVRAYRDGGESHPYLWLCQPMFCEVTASATTPPLYSPSGGGAYAAVDKEALARTTADGLMASDITNLELELGVAGSATASTGLIARTNKATTDIGDTAALNAAGFSTLVSAFTSLKAVLGNAAAGAFSALSSLVSNIDGRVTTQSTDIVNLTAQQNINSIVQNPQFNPWVGAFPSGWNQWGPAPTKYSGTNAVQFNVTSGQEAGLQQPVQNYAYIDVELTFMLISGALGGAGVHVQWFGSLGNAFGDYRLADYYPSVSDIYGKKITASFRIKRPAVFAGTFVNGYAYLMGNYNGLSPATTKNIVFYSCIMTNAGTSAEALEVTKAAVEDTATGLVATSNKVLNLESSMGANLIPGDTAFETGVGEWVTWSQYGEGFTFDKNLAGDPQRPSGINVLGVTMPGQPNGVVQIYCVVRVTEGIRYCFSAYTGSHRSDVRLFIDFQSSAGAYISGVSTNAQNSTGGTELSNWARTGVFATAPAGAAKAFLTVRMTRRSGESDPYMWFCRPMFSEVGVNTTQIPAYRVNDTNAKLQVVASTVATLSGAQSTYGVKTEVTGGGKRYAAGFAQGASYDANANTGTSYFGVKADRFFVTDNSGSETIPFVVQPHPITSVPTVFMNSAVIKNASIDSAKIANLSVDKIDGDTLNFIRSNIGTVVVDDIQGDSGLIYTLPSTEPLLLGDGFGLRNAPIGWVTIPARINNRAYGIQFFVQGSVLKSTAGSATISASFYVYRNGAANGTAVTKPASTFYVGANNFSVSNAYLPNNWSSFTLGSVATVYSNNTNYLEGVVVYVLNVNGATTVYLDSLVRLGFIPSDGAGCTLYVKTTNQRYHRKLGLSLATAINTTGASQTVRYNMSYLDTGSKTTTATNVLCVLSHDGDGNCTNQSVDFTLVSAR